MAIKKIHILIGIFAVVLISMTVSLSLINNQYFLLKLPGQPTTTIPPSPKYCDTTADCVPVGCKCRCSGCGGFSYDDVVNKKYADAWYYQQGCKPAEICPMVCCPPRTVACENNQCVVEEGTSNR